MKEKIKNTKGITLIALVVTIIILLILAGVAINIAVGDNGLFIKSKQSVEKYKEKSAEEKLNLALEEYFEDVGPSDYSPDVKNQILEEVLEKQGPIEDEGDDYKVIIDEWMFMVDKDTLEVTPQGRDSNIPPNEIRINDKNVEIGVGESRRLDVTITPSNAGRKFLKYTSSNEDIAIVRYGKVTGKAYGEVKIRVESLDDSNIFDECTVQVKEIEATGIKIDEETLTAVLEKQIPLPGVTIEPSNTTNKAVTWSIEDSSIAKITEDGKEIETLKKGETILKATTSNGITATCKLVVEEKGYISYSWDELGKVAEAISNNTTYDDTTDNINVKIDNKEYKLEVGDWKRINGKRVRILGFNHDTLSEGSEYSSTTTTGKAGISFEYVDYLIGEAKMNDEDYSNAGGWVQKSLYKKLNTNDDAAYKDIQAYGVPIKQVQKTYNTVYNKNATAISDDFLWLLSCSEIYGTENHHPSFLTGLSNAVEGSRYNLFSSATFQYWSSVPSIIYKTFEYWLRSMPGHLSGYFCAISRSDGIYSKSTTSRCYSLSLLLHIIRLNKSSKIELL